MKKVFALILLTSIASVGVAQDVEKEKEADSTVVRLGKKEIVLGSSGIKYGNSNRPKKADAYFAGIGVGLNILTGSNGSSSLAKSDRKWENEPIKSLTWSLNFYDVFVPLTANRHSFGLISGLGLTYKSFGLNANNQDIVTDNDTTFLVNTANGVNYDKRKFRVAYVSVPLLVGFNTSIETKKNFHISAGVIGNVLVGSIYKRKYTENGDEKKLKTRDDFNLSPLTVDATIRVGYHGYTLFANYGLNSLFKSGKGPDVTPITFGIQF